MFCKTEPIFLDLIINWGFQYDQEYVKQREEYLKNEQNQIALVNSIEPIFLN